MGLVGFRGIDVLPYNTQGRALVKHKGLDIGWQAKDGQMR